MRISDWSSDVCSSDLHRLFRFAVPFRIAEVLVRLHEVPDREEVLAVVSSRSAPDDLLELDHRPDWPHQHDVADVRGIHARSEEHTSELQSLMRISYAVFCLKKTNIQEEQTRASSVNREHGAI